VTLHLHFIVCSRASDARHTYLSNRLIKSQHGTGDAEAPDYYGAAHAGE